MAPDVQQHRLGLLLIGCAACFWSTSGLFIRTISADTMTMVFWRGIFSGFAVMTFFVVMERRRAPALLLSMRWPSFLVMAAFAMAMITNVIAIRYSTAADALTIYATVPFVTAALAWVTIGERPALRTMIAATVAIAGVGIMLGGAAWDGTFIGKIIAFGPALGMAIVTTTIRRHHSVAMLPAIGLACWLTSVTVFPFAAPLGISTPDLLLCAAFGVFQNASGLALFSIGSRHVPPAEATLLASLEVPLVPLWVWIFLNETPATATLIGGAIVLMAMFGHIALELKSTPVRSKVAVVSQ